MLHFALLQLRSLLCCPQLCLGGCQCRAGFFCTCLGLLSLEAQFLCLYLGLESFLLQLYLQSLLLSCGLHPLLLQSLSQLLFGMLCCPLGSYQLLVLLQQPGVLCFLLCS